MQLSLDIDDRGRTLRDIHCRLWQRFGRQGPFLLLDPVSQLVMAIIGGRTHGDISKAAFLALFKRFGTWEDLRDAAQAEIEALIADVTFADAKAPRLKAALRQVTDAHDRLSLESLRDLPIGDALAWLEQLPGVGRKSAAVVLNFSTLQRRALVIDTHHLRVLRRLRLVGWRCNTAQAYERIVPLLPADWCADDLSEHHQLVKTFGQQICCHAAPKCGACPLMDLCPTGRSRGPHRSPGTARALGTPRSPGTGDDLCHGCDGGVPAYITMPNQPSEDVRR